MNDAQLSYFRALYKLGSTSQAAREANISAQGLNKSIRMLECELGVFLFTTDESGRRTPTRFADVLFRHSEVVNASYASMMTSFEGIKAQQSKTVRIACSLGLSGYIATPLVKSFSSARPDISFTVREMNDRSCDRSLKNNNFDIGFTLAPFDEDLITIPLKSERVMFWINEDDSLADKPFIRPFDLNQRTISIFGEGMKVRSTLLELMHQVGAGPAEIVSSNEVFWHYENALTGKTVSFTVEHLVKLELFNRDSAVKAVPLQGMEWQVGISYSPRSLLPEYARDFFDHTVEYVTR
ncbi:LysR family transcriptional regulator [Cryptobacterium curtum]